MEQPAYGRFSIIARGDDLPFEIMLGMREGYGSGRHEPEHTLADVYAAHHEWQRHTGHVQGIFITPGILSYGWPDEGERIHGADEPACTVTGAINVIYDKEVPFGESKVRILSLAAFLADRLGQSRVYVRFVGECIVLEADGAVMPA